MNLVFVLLNAVLVHSLTSEVNMFSYHQAKINKYPYGAVDGSCMKGEIGFVMHDYGQTPEEVVGHYCSTLCTNDIDCPPSPSPGHFSPKCIEEFMSNIPRHCHLVPTKPEDCGGSHKCGRIEPFPHVFVFFKSGINTDYYGPPINRCYKDERIMLSEPLGVRCSSPCPGVPNGIWCPSDPYYESNLNIGCNPYLPVMEQSCDILCKEDWECGTYGTHCNNKGHCDYANIMLLDVISESLELFSDKSPNF
jgi:hypothetical protein